MTDQLSTIAEQQFIAEFQLLTWRDARGGPARRVRTAAMALARDLGSDPSTGQRMLIQRIAMLAALCEHTEVMLLNGRGMDVSEYVLMCATLARLLKLLGLRRVPRDVASLSDLLKADLEVQRERDLEQQYAEAQSP